MDIKPVPKLNRDSTQERANFPGKGKKDPHSDQSAKKENKRGDVDGAIADAAPVDSQIVDSEKVLELLSTVPTESHTSGEFARAVGKLSPAPTSPAKKLNKRL